MDGRYRRSGRLVVAAGVTSTLVGVALLSDGFGAFRTDLRRQTLSSAAQLHANLNRMQERWPAGRRDPEPVRRWVSQVDEPIVRTTDP